MKTIEQVHEVVRERVIGTAGRNPFLCVDGRDLRRVLPFFPKDLVATVGYEISDGVEWKPEAFTREAVLETLEKDVRFGFDKAVNQRGISSHCQFQVVRLWNWILEEGLESWPEEDYCNYGKRLFEETAAKYGWDL